jgi:hypothetical protein
LPESTRAFVAALLQELYTLCAEYAGICFGFTVAFCSTQISPFDAKKIQGCHVLRGSYFLA